MQHETSQVEYAPPPKRWDMTYPQRIVAALCMLGLWSPNWGPKRELTQLSGANESAQRQAGVDGGSAEVGDGREPIRPHDDRPRNGICPNTASPQPDDVIGRKLDYC